MTEPHTDAGLVIILSSDHESPIDLANAAKVAAQLPPDGLAAETWAIPGHHIGLPPHTVEKQGKVLQSGLALTPMAWTHTRHTVDWAIAWALIGEWASQELFPSLRHGNWPKHGHDGNLQEAYKRRRPCLVGWARAAFEQVSLLALLALPGGC